MKKEQKLNLEMHHLWYALEDLQSYSYPYDINEKIKELQFYVETKTFDKIPSGFNIIAEECILITNLEKSKFMNE